MVGLEAEIFWTMTFREVHLFLKRASNDRKARLLELQSLATLITNGVARVLGGDKVEAMTINTLYPEVFKEDIEAEEQISIQNELALNKARMDAFILRHRRKRGEVDG